MLSAIFAKAASKAIPWKWIGIGVGAVALAFFILWLLWTKAELRSDLVMAKKDLAAMTMAYESSRTALDELKRISAAKDKALVEHNRAMKAIEAERDTARRKWQEAIRNDKETRDWADIPLPDAVRGLLK